MQRENFLNKVKLNIAKYGHHITSVTGKELPRFAYTVGCSTSLEGELLFAGGEYYSIDDIHKIIESIVLDIKKCSDYYEYTVSIDSLGSFHLVEADNSWSNLLALGVFDYYTQKEVTIWQIVPDDEHFTLDIPDMSVAFDAKSNPVWQWLVRDWDYPVPRESTAVTNLNVLFGETATEVMRWEDDEWEIFSGAGPDTPKEDMRVVPLGVLLGIDKTLESVVYLKTGRGYWRENAKSKWNDWG